MIQTQKPTEPPHCAMDKVVQDPRELLVQLEDSYVNHQSPKQLGTQLKGSAK